MSPQPGEIWLADLGLAAKTRPVVIVSRQDPDPPRSLVLYVPLTTQRRDSPYEVPLPRLPFLDRESVANVQGLGSLPTVRLERRLGRLSAEIMERLKDALAFALDLYRNSDYLSPPTLLPWPGLSPFRLPLPQSRQRIDSGRPPCRHIARQNRRD